MDYCLLEDAFKTETVGCKDTTDIQSARKHERKKHKKNRDAFKSTESTFVAEANSVNTPALKDYSEAFQNIDIKLPIIPKQNGGQQQLPSYFLGQNDDDNMNIEGFSSEFKKSDEKGFEKTMGGSLPIPSISNSWKPLTPTKNSTAFFDELPAPGGTYPIWNVLNPEPKVQIEKPKKEKTDSEKSLHKKIDELIKRLDELEKSSKPTNQEEVLAFVGTGIFVIFALSLLK